MACLNGLRPQVPIARGYTLYVDVRRLVLVAFCLLIAMAWRRCRAAEAAHSCLLRRQHHRRVWPPLRPGLSRLPAEKAGRPGYAYKVVNQGTSGATTKDALADLPFVLRLHPAIVIVEFGGNDGLRGLPVDQTRSNLDQVLTGLENAHVKTLLAGITLPPDYGPDYIRSFDQIFRDLAAKHHVALVPMLYKNLINVPGTIQGDGIHPTAKGSAIIAGYAFASAKTAAAQGTVGWFDAKTATAGIAPGCSSYREFDCG